MEQHFSGDRFFIGRQGLVSMADLGNLTTITWILVSGILLLIIYFHGPSYSQQTVRHGPSILTSFGIFGTFLGIAFGLMQFDSSNIEASVPTMIDGLGVAVWSSIAGILGALSIRLRYAINSIRAEKTKSSEAATVSDLNAALVLLNENVSALKISSEGQAEKLLKSNESFQQDMVESNTQALSSAMSSIMTNFNEKIEVQYGENFKEFNESLGRLLEWQKSYSQQLNEMKSVQELSLQVITTAGHSYEEMISHSKEFNKIAASLGELLSGLEQQTSSLEGYLSGLSGLVGQASEGLPALGDYVSELTVKLSDSIQENNKELNKLITATSSEIAQTVHVVSKDLAGSVHEAHSGLAQHIMEMNTKTESHMQLLDSSMEKELTNALQTFGYQLTALSEKFVNDYIPLTDRLKELLEVAEQSTSKKQKVK